MGINQFIADVGVLSDKALTTEQDIRDVDSFPDEDAIFTQVPRWLRIEDVVVLVGDLTNSTRLSTSTHMQTTARIYEASTGGAICVVADARFDPAFIDIQGDGFFALFHGEYAVERAFAAGVTLKTWSERHLVPSIKEKIGAKCPETGFKVGLASGVLAVKNVGKPRKSSEPVWAGKPVNFAYKCAQAADLHEMIVTERVWQAIKDNQYVRFSCNGSPTHGYGTPQDLWETIGIETLGRAGQYCYRLTSGWCDKCGDAFCDAILKGERVRPEVNASGLALR